MRKVAVVGVVPELSGLRKSDWLVVTMDTVDRHWTDVAAVVVDSHDPRGRGVLETVRRDRPSVARLSVGGGCPRGEIRLCHASLDATRPATDVLERTCELASTIGAAAVAELIGSIDSLPTLPETYWAILKLARDPKATAVQVASVVEQDSVVALKALQSANSVGFGSTRRIGTIQQAVSMLGIDMVAALVASSAVFSATSVKSRAFSLEGFAAYSLMVARLARQFLPEDGDRAFAAGLFHDIGKLVIATRRPTVLSTLLADPEIGGLVAAEQRAFGCDHAALGGFVLDQWGLPTELVEAATYHHRPQAASSSAEMLVAAVHAAESLVGSVLCGEPSELDRAFLARVGVLDRLAEWEQLVRQSAV